MQFMRNILKQLKKKKNVRTRHKCALMCIFVRELVVHKICIVSLIVAILAFSGVTDFSKF